MYGGQYGGHDDVLLYAYMKKEARLEWWCNGQEQRFVKFEVTGSRPDGGRKKILHKHVKQDDLYKQTKKSYIIWGKQLT